MIHNKQQFATIWINFWDTDFDALFTIIYDGDEHQDHERYAFS
jgi:hypothetical protein